MTPTNAATYSANRTSLLSWEAIAEPHVPDRGPPSIPPDRHPNISLRDAVKLGREPNQARHNDKPERTQRNSQAQIAHKLVGVAPPRLQAFCDRHQEQAR